VNIILAGGCARREEKEKERDQQAKSANRTVFFHLIYQEIQFYGCSPRERVNDVYLIVMCD
jgi:hypothetical protein